MKNIMKVMFIGLALILSVSVACGPSTPAPTTPAPTTPAATTPPPAKTMTLKLASYSPPTSFLTLEESAVWAESVENATGGRIKIEIYAGGTLASAKDTVDAVTSGIADIASGYTPNHPGRFPLTSVVELPFIGIDTSTEGSIGIWQLYEEGYLGTEWDQFKTLFMSTTAPLHWMTVEKPIRNAADLKGLKMRVTSGYGGVDIAEAMEISPVQFSTPDLYDALQRGTIDGTLTSYLVVGTFKLDEVLNHYTIGGVNVGTRFMIMNLDVWNKISSADQKAIENVSGMLWAKQGGELYYKYDNAVLEEVKAKPENEVYTIPAAEMEKWRTLAKSIWNKWVQATGPEAQRTIDRALEIYSK